MNQQREFISETFHVLAQPITALRTTVELGLIKKPDGQGAQKVLKDCLHLIDRLMQDVAVLRESASLDEDLPLESCDGQSLLERSVEEMAPVAMEREIGIRLVAEPAAIECNEELFQRAMFVLLDETIASTPPGAEISISLHKGEDGYRLQARPGTPKGRRQELCRKLMQYAGGSEILSTSNCTSATFREHTDRPTAATT
jgi:signal transduction histidine kinase